MSWRPRPLIDRLARLEHDQWMQWARTLMEKEPQLSLDRKERWQKLLVPFDQLSEEWKEYDREWARKVIREVMLSIEEDPDEVSIQDFKQEGTPSERNELASVGSPRRMGRVEKDSVELGNDQDTCPTGVPISTIQPVSPGGATEISQTPGNLGSTGTPGESTSKDSIEDHSVACRKCGKTGWSNLCTDCFAKELREPAAQSQTVGSLEAWGHVCEASYKHAKDITKGELINGTDATFQLLEQAFRAGAQWCRERFVSTTPVVFNKEDHACSTGDCPHEKQAECDATLARDFPAVVQELLLNDLQQILDVLDNKERTNPVRFAAIRFHASHALHRLRKATDTAPTDSYTSERINSELSAKTYKESPTVLEKAESITERWMDTLAPLDKVCIASHGLLDRMIAEALAAQAPPVTQVRFEEYWNKETGEHRVDWLDCPEPYRTMLRQRSSVARPDCDRPECDQVRKQAEWQSSVITDLTKTIQFPTVVDRDGWCSKHKRYCHECELGSPTPKDRK